MKNSYSCTFLHFSIQLEATPNSGPQFNPLVLCGFHESSVHTEFHSFIHSFSRVQGLKDKVIVTPACGDFEPITARVAETEDGHQGFPASVLSASWARSFSAGDGPVNSRTLSRIAGLHPLEALVLLEL